LDDRTFEAVSAKLNEINTPGLYDRILREKCNLVACIQCWQYGNGPFPAYFHHLAPGPDVIDLNTRTALDRLAARCDRAIHSLDDALACMTRQVELWRADPKVVGVKSAHAYGRSIAFSRVTRHDAETVFNRILTHEGHALSAHEALPLQDFLMFELLARLDAVHLPMAFHTGIQAGNYNRIANANPLHLQPLPAKSPVHHRPTAPNTSVTWSTGSNASKGRCADSSTWWKAVAPAKTWHSKCLLPAKPWKKPSTA